MKGSFRIGLLFGISIYVHLTWFIIFALVTISLTRFFGAQLGGVAPSWIIGLIASLLFFFSVLFHEMAHSLLARRRGHEVKAITLFVFGGISEIGTEAERPSTEILVALIGPVSSFFLALIFGLVWYFTAAVVPVVGSIASWLMGINIALGIFNLLPGLPLDGGRILRGVIWKYSGNLERATRVSAVTGRILGYSFMLYGVYLSIVGAYVFNGLWLVLIGWFLVNAATASLQQMMIQRALAGVHAEQVMSTDCPYISPALSLSEFVEEQVLRSGRRCFIVGDQSAPRGLITLAEVRSVPRDQWANTSVQAVMRPLDRVQAVSPEADAEEVLRLMETNDLAQVPVVQNGKFIGLVGRDQLLRLIRNRLELAA